MKQSSYSNRIARNFLVATAFLILVIFFSIYLVVYKTVYNSLDENLGTEYHQVYNSLFVLEGKVFFNNSGEWEENEHTQIEVNPTFIQVSDTAGNVLRRSPNLQGTSLRIFKNKNQEIFFNAQLPTGQVRQVQMIITNKQGKKAGFISVAIPLEASLMVLKNLLFILLSAFPPVLFILYFIIRFMAYRSIMPVRILTESAGKIRHENLSDRIGLPQRKDELYTLTETINSLLSRIEDAMAREKQFSSDASHELRTPLSVLKGTLELMVRRPRDVAYFKEKSSVCLEEVNRMSLLVDQLLTLSRYEKEGISVKPVNTNITIIIDRIIARSTGVLEQRNIEIDLDLEPGLTVLSEPFMLEQVLENIFSNAVKYSNENGMVRIFSGGNLQPVSVTIQDEGIGMSEDEISRIFNRFYRADQSRSSAVKGYGLGLAIAKRLADLLGIRILVESRPGKGSAFTLIFPEKGSMQEG